ncbi:MAG: hypothetical protein KF749_15760 [Bacteroidetes bacterium]|nr:hypothetical protein [Bacteroidota bacterium]MCW5897356.1 hypothetical protein [Bacteroidota bacterium]
MKPSRAFWGIFLVAFGVLFLVGRNTDINLGWAHIWKFWPMVLVCIGLAVMLKDARVKWMLSGLAGVVAAVFLYGAVTFSWIDSIHAEFDDDAVDVQLQEFSEPFAPGIAKASFSLDAAAGKYTIDTATDDLFRAKVKTTLGRFVLDRESSGDDIHLRFKPEGKVHVKSWRFNHVPNAADIQLNPEVVWNIDVDAGAAEVDFDLSPFKISRLNVDAGAASLRLKLGMPVVEDMQCRIESGASSVRIAIPEEAACEIYVESGLSSKSFSGFEKAGSNRYRTKNFDTTDKKIYIKAEAGVSSIRVRRY